MLESACQWYNIIFCGKFQADFTITPLASVLGNKTHSRERFSPLPKALELTISTYKTIKKRYFHHKTKILHFLSFRSKLQGFQTYLLVQREFSTHLFENFQPKHGFTDIVVSIAMIEIDSSNAFFHMHK